MTRKSHNTKNKKLIVNQHCGVDNKNAILINRPKLIYIAYSDGLQSAFF